MSNHVPKYHVWQPVKGQQLLWKCFYCGGYYMSDSKPSEEAVACSSIDKAQKSFSEQKQNENPFVGPEGPRLRPEPCPLCGSDQTSVDYRDLDDDDSLTVRVIHRVGVIPVFCLSCEHAWLGRWREDRQG